MKRWTLVLIVALVTAAACAKAKPNLVAAHAGVETGLAVVDDTERVLCFGQVALPANPRVCNQNTPGLTSEVHQQISVYLSQAFAAQQRLADQIKTWKTGDPAPSSATEVLAVAQKVKDLASAVGNAQFLNVVQTWLDNLDKLNKTLGGK